MLGLQHVKARVQVASRDVPFARVHTVVIFAAQPLAEVWDAGVNRIGIDDNAVFFRHAPRVPTRARWTALGHGAVGFGEGIAFAHELVNSRCVYVFAAERRDRIGVHLIDVYKENIGFHMNHLAAWGNVSIAL